MKVKFDNKQGLVEGWIDYRNLMEAPMGVSIFNRRRKLCRGFNPPDSFQLRGSDDLV